jgi:transcriptional regulator with XRE-family HTH domain
MKKETVGDRIHRRREQLGMSIQELARLLECDDGRVWSWRGDRKPRMPMLRKVAVALRTSVEWLLYGKGDPDDKPMIPDHLQTPRPFSPLRSAAAPMPPSNDDDDSDDGTTIATWDDTEPVTIEMIQKRRAELIAMYAARNGHAVEDVKITVSLM